MSGAYVDPSAGRVTVGEWSEQWLTAQLHLKPKTRASYASLLRGCVLPRWATVPLSKVTYGTVAEWVADLHGRGLSASRVRQAYHLLTGMLDDAVKDGRLIRNPASGVELPRLVSKQRRYLRHNQLHALADARGLYRVLVLTLGYCGLRWSELAATTWCSPRPRARFFACRTSVGAASIVQPPRSGFRGWFRTSCGTRRRRWRSPRARP